jgi:hypothetical protein
MPSAVLKLIRSLSADRLEKIPDYIEYWDKARKGGDVGPGFLYDLIKTGDPLPAGFETSRKRADRLTAEDRSKNRARLQEALKAEYEDHGRRTIDRFIAEELPPGEFESRVAAYMADPSNQSDFWNEKPDLAEQFGRHAVRAEIAKGVSLPAYEDFYRRELPRIASKLQLDPAELSLEAGEESPTPVGSRNAVDVPTSDVPSQSNISTISNQNSSPPAGFGL